MDRLNYVTTNQSQSRLNVDIPHRNGTSNKSNLIKTRDTRVHASIQSTHLWWEYDRIYAQASSGIQWKSIDFLFKITHKQVFVTETIEEIYATLFPHRNCGSLWVTIQRKSPLIYELKERRKHRRRPITSENLIHFIWSRKCAEQLKEGKFAPRNLQCHHTMLQK